ncbi:unnamed protein product [Durusdinium trenchii]|uniref:Uncharacterized protein n=1 Tax=Durusdinium trenchii TaxID=1381693 RepID=A0ABP0J510_9DINO
MPSCWKVVEAYDELVEISLLVSNCTGLLDIEEAHLRFDRGSSAQRTIETGMPTLRRFIRPTDWDRIEGAGTAGTGSCGRPYRHDALHQAVKDNKLKT